MADETKGKAGKVVRIGEWHADTDTPASTTPEDPNLHPTKGESIYGHTHFTHHKEVVSIDNAIDAAINTLLPEWRRDFNLHVRISDRDARVCMMSVLAQRLFERIVTNGSMLEALQVSQENGKFAVCMASSGVEVEHEGGAGPSIVNPGGDPALN